MSSPDKRSTPRVVSGFFHPNPSNPPIAPQVPARITPLKNSALISPGCLVVRSEADPPKTDSDRAKISFEANGIFPRPAARNLAARQVFLNPDRFDRLEDAVIIGDWTHPPKLRSEAPVLKIRAPDGQILRMPVVTARPRVELAEKENVLGFGNFYAGRKMELGENKGFFTGTYLNGPPLESQRPSILTPVRFSNQQLTQDMVSSSSQIPATQKHLVSSEYIPLAQPPLPASTTHIPVPQTHLVSSTHRPLSQTHLVPSTHQPVPQSHLVTSTHQPVPQSHLVSTTHQPVPQSHLVSTTHRPVPQSHLVSTTHFLPVISTHVSSTHIPLSPEFATIASPAHLITHSRLASPARFASPPRLPSPPRRGSPSLAVSVPSDTPIVSSSPTPLRHPLLSSLSPSLTPVHRLQSPPPSRRLSVERMPRIETSEFQSKAFGPGVQPPLSSSPPPLRRGSSTAGGIKPVSRLISPPLTLQTRS